MPRNAREWPGMTGNARECVGMPGDARECPGMPGNARESLGMLGNARECPGNARFEGPRRRYGAGKVFVLVLNRLTPRGLVGYHMQHTGIHFHINVAVIEYGVKNNAPQKRKVRRAARSH